MDAGGDGCEWYEEFDAPGCPEYGSDYEGTMGVANDNCCHCRACLADLRDPSSSSASTTCENTLRWYDFEGYDCPWYEVMDEPGCPKFGDRGGPGDLEVAKAKDNCCHCKNTTATDDTFVSES